MEFHSHDRWYANRAHPTQDARASANRIDEIVVPPRDARGFEVPEGHFFRILSVEGPQVGDINLWNSVDLSEQF